MYTKHMAATKFYFPWGATMLKISDLAPRPEVFYKNLYSNKDDPLAEINLQEYLKEGDVPKLSDNESNQIEGHLILSELSKALRNMKNNKSPGTDGY